MHHFSTLLLILAVVIYTPAHTVELDFVDGDKQWHEFVGRTSDRIKTDKPIDSIAQFLIDYGFLDSRVYESPEDGNKLTVQFGERYEIGKVVFEGDLHDIIQVNMEFSPELIITVMDSILVSHHKQGYYYYSTEFVRATESSRSVDVIMRVSSGPVVTVSSVETANLTTTDPGLVKRYIPVSPGDTLRPSMIRSSVELLNRFEYVNLTGEPIVIPDAGYNTASVKYIFTEKRQFSIDGAAGYIPDDNGYFIWYINTQARNMFGGGRSIRMMVDRREKDKSLFSAGYSQPVFLIGTGEVGLNIRTRDYRDQFYEFEIDGKYRIDLGSELDINLGLGWKNVEPARSENPSYQVYKASTGVRFGQIDNNRESSGSYSVNWDIAYLGRRYNSDGDSLYTGKSIYNDTKNDIRIEAAKRLFKGLAGYSRANVVVINSSEKPLPISELHLFGGPESFRGYRNDQFASDMAILATHEWHIFLGHEDYLYPFADYAYFELDDFDADGNIKKNTDDKWGYGFGINVFSSGRRLIVEFAWGDKAAFDEPRLSVVLSGAF